MTNAHAPTPSKFTVKQHVVDYADPFVSDDLDAIDHEVASMIRQATDYYGERAANRKRTSAIDFDNPATRRLLEQAPTCSSWLATVPSAAALHPLYDPETSAYPHGEALCDEIRRWFRNLADARGIRSRAAVMKQLLAEGARSTAARQEWLSLACGAAQPLFQTMNALRDEGESLPCVRLADLDARALRLARDNSRSYKLDEYVEFERMNVLKRSRIRPRSRWRGARDWTERFDVVDAVGLLEYLGPEDWIYTYRGVVSSKRPMAGAVTFLRNSFDCVKPGGRLIVGNMLDTHPQLDFTLNVVQWPHIQPRSIPDMFDLFDAAGLRGHVDVYLPADGVYAVYALTKPLDSTRGGSRA